MRRLAIVVSAAILLAAPSRAAAQPGDPDLVRVGVSIGGTHLVAVDVELHYDRNSVNLSLGTWLFEDLTVTLTARRYLRESTPSPYIGAGFWAVGELSAGVPFATFFHAPAGIDWRVVGPQHIGAAGDLSLRLGSGALGEAETPVVERRLLFLPSVYLKWGR